MKFKPTLYDDTLALHAESRGEQENDLNAARGIMNGLFIAAVGWGALGLIVWIYRSVTR